MVAYHHYIDIKCKPKWIAWNDADNYDFSKGFIEFFGKGECLEEDIEDVHSYFIFDTIKNEEELDVFKWLDGLNDVFGPYSACGYTDNEYIFKKNSFRHFPKGKHFVSFNVVFYTVQIKLDELVEIIKYNKNGFVCKQVYPKCDKNPYKGNGKQSFRHASSDKLYCTAKMKPETKYNNRYILKRLPPNT